jgi:hypothetical protein
MDDLPVLQTPTAPRSSQLLVKHVMFEDASKSKVVGMMSFLRYTEIEAELAPAEDK